MKITNAEDIGWFIKKKRKDDGLNLEESAAACGVSYPFLSALENGKEDCTAGQTAAGAKRLGINLSASVRTWTARGGI